MHFEFEELKIYLYIALLTTIFFQIFYFAFYYLRLIFYKKKSVANYDKPSVSVIIAAQNESENLKTNLKYFLQQNYPDFKVIVVNDASVDDSATILAQMQSLHNNLYVTNIPLNKQFRHGKKTALTIGIKAAETDILLFSDADCKPSSENWIQSIVANFDIETQIVIGYGGFEKEKGFLNRLIRTDNVFIAMNYLSFALARTPYMAVGRNMAYRKSFFMQKKGFASQMNLLSGSDDLFINQNATPKNLKTEISPESFTLSKTKRTFKEWKIQKTRHLTTAKYYKFKHKFLLAFEPFTRLLTYFLSIFLMILNYKLIVIALLFTFRNLLFYFIFYKTSKKLNQKGLFITAIFFDLIQPFLNLIFYIFARKKNELIWK